MELRSRKSRFLSYKVWLTLVGSVGLVSLIGSGLTGCGRDNVGTTNVQNSSSKASYAARIAMSGMSRTAKLLNPLERHRGIEDEINRLTGQNSSVVLQEGPRAYVGVPNETGKYGYQSALSEARIVEVVTNGSPTVTSVLVTRNVGATHMLHKYADELSTGVDLTRRMVDFHKVVSSIWPPHR